MAFGIVALVPRCLKMVLVADGGVLGPTSGKYILLETVEILQMVFAGSHGSFRSCFWFIFQFKCCVLVGCGMPICWIVWVVIGFVLVNGMAIFLF